MELHVGSISASKRLLTAALYALETTVATDIV